MSKEELTTKMHSEFNISDEANVKLTAFMALEDMKEFNYSIQEAAVLYNLTENQITQHQEEYNGLLSA